MKTKTLETLEQLKEHIKESQKYYTGYVKGTKSRFGFVQTEQGDEIFIPPHEMDRVFPGDKVTILVKTDQEQENTTITEIIENNFKRFVGSFTEDETGAYVLPSDSTISRKIRIPKAMRKGAKNNQFVKAEMIEQPDVNRRPKARILSVIGVDDAPGIENDFIIAKYNIPYKPSFEARKEIINFDWSKIEKAQQQSNRVDLTHIPFITIDGEATMDIDDAIYAEPQSDCWKLWVAISDVSEFVEPESAIDWDAYRKTSSVYFTGKMIPMLPGDIATEIGSLKENTDKVAIVVEMTISNQGELVDTDFKKANIRSRAKMSYNEIEDFIINDSDNFKYTYKELTQQVSDLYKLHQILNHNRKINYIIPDLKTDFKLLLDSDRKIKEIQPNEYKISNRMVEECMIITNIAAAQFLKTHYHKALYKIHEGVNDKKIEQLRTLMERHFPTFPKVDINDMNAFKEMLQHIQKNDTNGYFKQLLTLHMNRSAFSVKPENHFGLGFEEYTYFTSPNRRYADLIVHRLIKAVLDDCYYEPDMDKIVDNLNSKTRKIETATEEAENWLKCIYMNTRRSETFEAQIINATSTSIMVRLVENGVEGILPVKTLSDDGSDYDEIERIHTVNGKPYKVGDTVSVAIKNINFKNKSIVFKQFNS